jgi:Tol biopolymer transport system component
VAALVTGCLLEAASSAGATTPGRNGSIAYASKRGTGLYEIYLMTPGGRVLKQLTHTPAIHDLQPAWSPDGKRIAFVRRSFADENHPGPWEVWVMNADGGRQRRIARGTEPTWSPDGGWIAFTGAYTPRVSRPDIWVARADGSDRRRLTVNSAFSDRSPDWSPDGNLIAYTTNAGGFGNSTRGLWTMRPDGSHKRLLTPRGVRTGSPSWSPDGKKIAFVRSPGTGPSAPAGLWTIDRDGSNEHALGVPGVTSCSWAPAGDAIAYSASGMSGVDGDIFTVGLGGNPIVTLTRGDADDVDPAWQPLARR